MIFEEGCQLETISKYLFYGTGIVDISIPEGVKTISDGVFRECKSLRKVVLPDTLEALGHEVFKDSGLQRINLPKNLKNIGVRLFSGCLLLEYVEICINTGMGTQFNDMPSLKTVVFSQDVSQVPGSLFQNCVKLENVTLSDTITEIQYNAFSGCKALKSIALPAGLKTIEDDAFSRTGLMEIVIPDSVTEIQERAFRECKDLTTVKWGTGLKEVGNCVFQGCTSLKAFDLCNTEIIGTEAFDGCTSLEKMDLTGILELRDFAFSDCTALKQVTLGDKLGTIKYHAFYNCDSLEALQIKGKDLQVEQEAFAGSDNLKSVTFSDGLVLLSHNIFRYCPKLETVKIYANYVNFADNALVAAEGLTLYGWAGSSAETYALENNITFVPLVEVSEHTYDMGKITAEATCTQAGTKLYTCVDCAATLVREIPALGHNCAESTVQQEATCAVQGVLSCRCSVCGESYSEPIPTVAHRYSRGKCSVCGALAVTRVYGATRYETAFRIADSMKEVLGVEKYQTVIVASGMNFADALSGSYLASVKDAPILLVRNRKQEIDAVREYIHKNLEPGGTVYILGGTAAVPAAMESGLDGFTVKRLWGKDRYETNVAILKEAGVTGTEILVCTGKDFADSLSASASGLPILLVGNELTEAQYDFLRLGYKKVIIIGGVNAVSKKLEGRLISFLSDVERIGGASRYETSVLVAQRFFTDPTGAVLAYAKNFPDGLSGGALAVSMHVPLILTAEGKQTQTAIYTRANGIKSGIVLGGPTLISDNGARTVFSVAPNVQISRK